MDSKYCKIRACGWACRFEIVGIVLIVIATYLTITTANSAGIVMLFIAGVALLCHSCLSATLKCHHSGMEHTHSCHAPEHKKSKTKE